jgi:hypothetical protein
MPDDRTLLRHTLATLAYRGGKTVRDSSPEFANFGAPATTQTPAKILAHIGDLMDWALSMVSGSPAWHNSTPLPWDKEGERFHAAVSKFDDYLASGQPLQTAAEKLFQGPIADALTHVGQLAMLRRMAGCPIRGENYFAAEITTGRVGADQAAPRNPFA